MSSISPGLRTALLERLLRDRAAGTLRPSEEYARDFPGFEREVGDEYARFVGGAPPAAPEDGTAGFEAAFARDRAAGRVARFSDYLHAFPDEARRIADRLAELDCGGADATAAHVVDAGARLGPYRVLRLIGRGGQGDVFLAEDTRLHRNVALKVLRSDFVRRIGALERFRREAAYASRLDHPGICSVYEADTIDGAPFVAMRFVEGETLAARIRRERDGNGARAPTPPELLARAALIEQAARAVAAAHDAGILHRDLKPANIVVTPDGRPVLLDFGLAHAEESGDVTLTGSGDLFGTPAYMSPEQASGANGRVDARTDVWALGVTLYELLTLELPFQAPSRGALLRLIEEEEAADPRTLVPQIPRDLAAVVLAALEKDPQRRYRSAAAFADDLQALREGRAVSVVVPGPLDRLLRFARREPAKAVLASALVLALFAAAGSGGYLFARRGALDVGNAELERREAERAALASLGFGRGRREATPASDQLEFLARNPHFAVARASLLDSMLNTDRAEEALATARLPVGVAAEPDEAQMMRRMRIAALRALHRDEEARIEEAALFPDAWPVEQYAAGLLAWERFLKGDRASLAAAFDHFDRAIFLSRRAELLFHLMRARALMVLTESDATLLARERDSARALATLFPENAEALKAAAQMTHPFDVAGAGALARRATEIDPLCHDAFVLWSFAELELHHEDVAAAAYRAGVAAAERGDPTAVWSVHRHFGEQLLALGDAEAALPPLKEAIRLAPAARSASRLLCRALDAMNRRDELKAELTRRVAIAPDDGLAWFLLARERFLSDDRAGAREAVSRANAHRDRLPDEPDWRQDQDDWQRDLDELQKVLAGDS